MFTKSASTNKFKRAVSIGCLFLMLFLNVYTSAVRGQKETPNLLEPLKKCRVYGSNNGLSRIIASDNDSNVILATDNYTVVSVNPATNLENWKSSTGGKLETEVSSDEGNLFFITSFEKESKEKTFTLNSISLKTGITNWQKKLTDYSSIGLIRIKHRELLFLLKEDNSLVAILKNNGETRWTKEFANRIVAVESSKPEHLSILMEDRLFRALTKSGEVFEEIKLKQSFINNAVVTDTYLLLGNSTGEIAKITLRENKNDRLWKIKAGAAISGLIEYRDEVLVTSLDNFIYLFSTESGKLKWKKRVAGRIYIKPFIYGGYAVVVNSGDDSVSMVDLRDGRVVNQIQLEPGNYFSGEPLISGIYLVLQTSRGTYFFANRIGNCK